MIIKKLIPNGFCYGVITAYNKILNIINEHSDKKIYMLGWLVHNEKIINLLKEKKVIILDDYKTNRYDIIKQFDNNIKNSILILSAHGTDLKTIELAKQKGFQIYDLTCKYVYKTHDLIKQKIIEGYDIIFIGKSNHPETNAILAINKKIILIENEKDIEKIKKDKKYFCTNQTTISQYEFKHLINLLQLKNKGIEFVNDICDATKIRQDAVINMSDEFDICIVIGDKRSSNTNELFKLAKQKINDSYMINDIKDINFNWFKNKKQCAITAGASTPGFLIECIITYIERNYSE